MNVCLKARDPQANQLDADYRPWVDFKSTHDQSELVIIQQLAYN
jgi:hypothetical protein